ncbi:DUF202 domain-containing protein [Pantoea sp. Tr-811]|nr:DUF202 domain-containing protein [Pantoea sp. Tr-811]
MRRAGGARSPRQHNPQGEHHRPQNTPPINPPPTFTQGGTPPLNTNPERSRGWLANKLLADGQEPDPRFTLANERTFLAWIRTSLALLASGIAIDMFTAEIFSAGTRRLLAVALICLALLLSLPAFVRWLNVERAMRQKRPLPFPLIAPALSIGVSLVMVVFAYAVFFHA